MFHRIYSTSLDPNKAWYAFNDRICFQPPRRFCENDIFKLFPEEICNVYVNDIRDEHGRPVSSSWFNSGAKAKDKVFVGSLFALIAGNLRRKNPAEGEFFRTELFKAAKDFINKFQQPSEGGKEESPPKVEEFPPKSPSTPSGSASSSSAENSPVSVSSVSDIENSTYAPLTKKRKIRRKVKAVMGDVDTLCGNYGETLGNMIAECCLFKRKSNFDGKKVVSDVFVKVEKELGVRRTFKELIPGELWQKRIEEMCVPDWILLLTKLESRISDDGWQMLLNRTKLGKSGSSSDASILLTKNSIKALRSMVFGKVRDMLELKSIEEPDIPGFQVSLEPVVSFLVRELRLHGQLKKEVQLNLKLDGRPFYGRNQVLIGVVPMETPFLSNQSCKSVCPLALANCKEDRESLKKLIKTVNRQKDVLKKNGITVDGIKHTLKFKVILDLKALYLMLVKHNEDDFHLGKRGSEVEFCFICRAIRGCNCDLGPHAVCLEHFSITKANIGGFKGIRDDLEFLLEEDLLSINLCALHCELRNTEQLLTSLGLFAYKVDSLEECNKELSQYGPENFNSRITVKLKEGQETAVEKHNIQLASFSGNTEREFLSNIESIVRNSLPHDKLMHHYGDPQVAKLAILNKVTFCNDRIKYYQDMIASNTFIRDFGSRQEEITLTGSEVGKEVQQRLEGWQNKLDGIEKRFLELSECATSKGKQKGKKRQKVSNDVSSHLSSYAAEVVYDFFLKVFTSWREIAEIIRNRVFKEGEQHLIDIFDIECKEWGFLLREMFGNKLGTGDYGHMTIEHVSMLMRNFLSLKEYSNQGFEASHSLQRQLYSKATSHDRHGYTSSIQQMLQHFFAEKLLFMRLSFRMALQCMESEKPFYFKGCGWSRKKNVMWSKDDMMWIVQMENLFTEIFGNDFLVYEWDKAKGTLIISPDSLPCFRYNHALWEEAFLSEQPQLKCSVNYQPSAATNSTPLPSVSKPQPPCFALNDVALIPKEAQNSVSHNSTMSTTCSPSFDEDLKACASSKITRGQLATLNLPPVVHIADNSIQLIAGAQRLSNPLKLTVRPSESTLNKCYQLMNQASYDSGDSDTEDQDISVQIGDLGAFDYRSLDIMMKASTAASVKQRVKEEESWLSQSNGILTATQIQEVGSLLFDSEPQQEILRIGDVIVDVNDLSTLAGERYLTGFLIDAACLKFSEEAISRDSRSLYLPSFTQTWASSDNLNFLKSKIAPYVGGRDLSGIVWILTPIHVNGNHWGLLCLNMVLGQIFYDDGLKWNPPLDICEIIKRLTDAIFSPHSNADWNIALPIKRFGMPRQPSVGEGSASCGVAVVLAAYDFLTVNTTNGTSPTIPNFNWQFQDMAKHRQRILYQFVEWKL